MRRLLVLLLANIALSASAQDVNDEATLSEAPIESSTDALAETSSEEEGPEEVLVTGTFPGPGMWKVTRADAPDGNTLWILGTPPPLPKRMKWKSTDVESVIKSSQEILLAPSVQAKPDEKIGFFKGLTLLPSALGARKNPDKDRLQDVLAPELYARWLVLKKQYLGSKRNVEKFRPIFAAYELRGEAFDDLKMRENGIVNEAVEKLAKKHKIKTTTPTMEFAVHTKEIKAKIKEFAQEALADTECFSITLDLVETISDRAAMEARANAWATGDLATLLAMPALPNPNLACVSAFLNSQVAQTLIPSDIDSQLRALWLEAAEKSLAENASTFAYLSLDELTSPQGQLAALRAKGYVVDEPKRD